VRGRHPGQRRRRLLDEIVPPGRAVVHHQLRATAQTQRERERAVARAHRRARLHHVAPSAARDRPSVAQHGEVRGGRDEHVDAAHRSRVGGRAAFGSIDPRTVRPADAVCTSTTDVSVAAQRRVPLWRATRPFRKPASPGPCGTGGA
jgi:hypothetical protein